MANKQLFRSLIGKLIPGADVFNKEAPRPMLSSRSTGWRNISPPDLSMGPSMRRGKSNLR